MPLTHPPLPGLSHNTPRTKAQISEHAQHQVHNLQKYLPLCLRLGEPQSQHQGPRFAWVLGRYGVCDLRSEEVAHHLPLGRAGTEQSTGREARGGQERFVRCEGRVEVGV